MTNSNMVCIQPSKKSVKELGARIVGIVGVFELARNRKSSHNEKHVVERIDQMEKQVMEASGNRF